MSRELIPIKRILASGKRCRERGDDYPIVRWFIDLCIHYERLESDLASVREKSQQMQDLAGAYKRDAIRQADADQKQMQDLCALVKRHEDALEKVFTMGSSLGKNAPSEYVVVFDKPSPDKQWRVFADSPLAAIEAAKGNTEANNR